MNTSKKWLVAIGSALTLGVAAVAAHAAADEKTGAAEHSKGGMHRGMQEGKGPGTMSQGMQGKGMQRMSSEKSEGHQHGAANVKPGEHRQTADAHGAGHHGSNEKHQHGQGQGSGQGKESGGHSH
jgi:hypothetical protein